MAEGKGIWFVIKRLVIHSFSEHSSVETLKELTDSAAGLKQLQGLTFLNTRDFLLQTKCVSGFSSSKAS